MGFKTICHICFVHASFFTESGTQTRNKRLLGISAFVFSTPCRLHSPPKPPRVAAQEAVLSRKTTGSMINTVRSGPIVPSAPASASVPLWSGVEWSEVEVRPNWSQHRKVTSCVVLVVSAVTHPGHSFGRLSLSSVEHSGSS